MDTSGQNKRESPNPDLDRERRQRLGIVMRRVAPTEETEVLHGAMYWMGGDLSRP